MGTSSAQPQADLVLRNGKIWTVNDAQPVAQAVACSGNRIVFVGTSEGAKQWIGSRTQTIDLGGRLVVPGFNDAHVHFISAGANLAGVQLRDATSSDMFRRRIRDFALTISHGLWITGGNWDHENWSPATPPTRWMIDSVTPHNPVFVNRLDGHMALANSLALKAAGITRDSPDPPGGTIVRDSRGEPTGLLKDAAMDAVYAVMPSMGEEEITRAAMAGMRYAMENGVTSVQDMSASEDIFAVYQKLLRENRLTLRIYCFQPLPLWRRQAAIGLRAAFGGEKLTIGGEKGFADGSLGSTTALFFEPYLDAPNTSGLPNEEMIPESKMLGCILGADSAGLQIAVHAIGDRANHIILGMFAEAERHNGARDRRFRIEHAQHLTPDDIPRFAGLGVIASMQPYHAIDDGRWAEKRIGPRRAKSTYAFRSLLDAGAVLAFGSDWDVAPMKPLLGIYAAATRRTLDGKHPDGWVPEQKITVAEAIRAYTMGSAYASFEENLKGSIQPGKVADMVVLSSDILTIPPEEIERASVEMTIFDGRVIYTHGMP